MIACGELAQAAQLVARDPDAHRLLGAGEPPGDPRAPLLREQRAARQLELGPEIVQMPLQRAVELDAVTDQPFAVIDQQPQIELGPVQVRGREGLQALLQRGAGDVERVDRSDLPRWRALLRALAVRCVGIRNTRSPRSIRNRSSDPDTCRQSSSAQTRSPSRPRAHRSSAPNPRRPTWTVCSPSSSPVAAADRRRPCANACECPRRARS